MSPLHSPVLSGKSTLIRTPRIGNNNQMSYRAQDAILRIARAVLQEGYQRETRLHVVLLQRRAV